MTIKFDFSTLSQMNSTEIKVLKTALAKLDKPEPKLTKEDAEVRFEVVNTVLESMRSILEILNQDIEPPRLEIPALLNLLRKRWMKKRLLNISR